MNKRQCLGYDEDGEYQELYQHVKICCESPDSDVDYLCQKHVDFYKIYKEHELNYSRKNHYTSQVKIRLSANERARGKYNKCIAVVDLFDYVILNYSFLFEHERFFVTVRNKIKELFEDMKNIDFKDDQEKELIISKMKMVKDILDCDRIQLKNKVSDIVTYVRKYISKDLMKNYDCYDYKSENVDKKKNNFIKRVEKKIAEVGQYDSDPESENYSMIREKIDKITKNKIQTYKVMDI